MLFTPHQQHYFTYLFFVNGIFPDHQPWNFGVIYNSPFLLIAHICITYQLTHLASPTNPYPHFCISVLMPPFVKVLIMLHLFFCNNWLAKLTKLITCSCLSCLCTGSINTTIISLWPVYTYFPLFLKQPHLPICPSNMSCYFCFHAPIEIFVSHLEYPPLSHPSI